MFCNLSKNNDGTIRCDSATTYSKLSKSVLEDADKALYKAVPELSDTEKYGFTVALVR